MRRLATFWSSLVVLISTLPASAAADRTISGTIRDFKGAFSSTAPYPVTPGGHPHFEIFTFNSFLDSRIPSGFNVISLTPQIGVSEPGIVASALGADNKPVWVGGDNSQPQAPFPTTKTKVNAAGTNLVLETDDNVNRANFNQWYNDTAGVNMTAPFELTLTDPDNDGILTYTNNNFFPIDNQLFGNEGRAHNQHFTIEIHDQITYQPGQTFTFTGGDDLWVFVNKQLALDLGGVHQVLSKTINLDTLGLTPGNTYPFDLFYAERNTFGADIAIQTNIPLGAIPEPAGPILLANLPLLMRRRT